MRIISKFHDYYDVVQKTGMDRSVLFLRDELIYDDIRHHGYFDNTHVYFGVIRFCGTEYPFIEIDGQYYYDIKKIPIEKIAKNINIRSWFERPKRAFFSKFSEDLPILIYFNGTIMVNGMLKRFNFHKVIDPYIAFNTIYQFLAALARPIKPMPEISNNDKIQSHGFDKFSFRKGKKE